MEKINSLIIESQNKSMIKLDKKVASNFGVPIGSWVFPNTDVYIGNPNLNEKQAFKQGLKWLIYIDELINNE